MSNPPVRVLDDNSNVDGAWSDYIQQSNLIDHLVVSGNPSATVITCSSQRFFGSYFTTAAVQQSFEVSQQIIKDAGSVILGLDSSKPGNLAIPIGDILSAFSVTTSSLPDIIGTIVTILSSLVGNVLPNFRIDSSPGSKDGVWITAMDSQTLEIATALTLVMNPLSSDTPIFDQSFHDSLKNHAALQPDLSTLKFSSSKLPRLRMKQKAIISKDANNNFSTGTLYEIMVEIPVAGFLISLRANSNGRLSVGVLNDGGSIGDVFGFLANGPSENEAKPSESGLAFLDENSISFWKLVVRFPGDDQFLGSDISFEIGFTLTLHIASQTVLIGLTYDTQSKTFSGRLLTQGRYLGRLDINWDDMEDLPAGMLATISPSYDLTKAGVFQGLPKSVLPTTLAEAAITFTKTSADSPYEFTFNAEMTAAPASASSGGSAPSVPFPFTWDNLTLGYYRRGAITDDNGKQLEDAINTFSITSTFDLTTEPDNFLAGTMFVSFDCAIGGSPLVWSLSASASRIQLGAIVKFFDPQLSGQVRDVLGKITINSIDASYTYQEDVASSFLIYGAISVGDLQLKLYYQYTTASVVSSSAATQAKSSPGDNDFSDLQPIAAGDVPANGSAWRFDATLDLNTVGGAVTVGQIADSIVNNASNSLPGFIKDINVVTTANDHLVGFHCSSLTSQTSSGAVPRAIFLLDVSITSPDASLEFTIEQISSQLSSSPDPITKRLLRVSAGKLPLLDKLPVVNLLPQPWQKLQYMWSPADGLTRDEVAALNSLLTLDGSDNQLYFKPATKDDADPTSTSDNVVLVEGHHFVVVYNGQAVVDHVFGSNEDQPQPPPGSPPQASSEPAGGKPPSKGTIQLHTGILDITAVSLQYKQPDLYVFLDATLALGPLELSLIGFGIGLNIGAIKLNDLSTIVTGLDFQLHGLSVSFDEPPILISGCFYHDTIQNGNATEDVYRGGIAVEIPPYTFVAVGEYAVVTVNSVEFKSVFVYAKLDGPIIDLEFAMLEGLRIGFGYNSSVRSPAVEELAQFPLIDDSSSSSAGNHPMAILEAMEGGPDPFVQVKQDNYWLAFGFTISAFDLVAATVVALVQFGDAGCIFTLFGDLTISFPTDGPPDVKLFNIEVLMMAELNFVDDVFKLEAALAPTSFVLVPQCKLFGGLALYTFFGSSPHAGDWVLTVGGYHRMFDVPAWYPNPSRIGLDFNVTIIHIRGEGYFAITPKAIMTGCMIRCELSLGPVYAWLDTAFDAMVQFTPLHYWVSMSVEVGVECDVPVLFCTVHIKISIGAGLSIEGPQFGGTAYVDFWFFSFSFDFGNSNPAPAPISLADFYALCEKSGPPDTSPNNQTSNDLVVQIKMSLEDGSFPMPSEDKATAGPPDDTGAGTKWFVKGGSFQFRVSSVFAITNAYIETKASSNYKSDGTTDLLEKQQEQVLSKMQQVTPAPTQSKLSSLPMQLSADLSNPNGNGITSNLCMAIQDTDENNLPIEGFKPSFIMKAMPQTLWSDPNNPINRLSQDKGTIDLPMAVDFSAPDPILAYSKIPEFNATDMAKECAGGNIVPQLPPVNQTELLPDPLPATTATQSQQWSTMAQTWSDSSKNNLSLANAMTTLCMTALGWGKPPPNVVPVAFPSRLVTGTGREALGIEDGLDSFYLELPRTTVAPVH